MTSRPKVLIYLLRRDLRLSDNPVYHEIWRIHSSDSSGRFTHLLPLYVFPAQQIDVSGFLRPPSGADSPLKSPYPEPRSQQGGYRRCGPHRAKFLAESVWDLKESLDKAGSGLCIRAGRLAEVIKSVLDFFEQDESTSKAKERVQSVAEAPKENPSPESRQRGEIVGVWMCSEEGTEERSDEMAVQSVVEERGKEFRLFEDEKYLIDDRDLPFSDIQDLPDVFTTFRKSLEPLRARPRDSLPAPPGFPPFPPSDCIPPPRSEFIIPATFADLKAAILKPLPKSLGLPNPPTWPADEKDLMAHSAHPFTGGETVGLERISHLILTGAMSSYKDTRNGLLGLDFSTKLSAYLAFGCITARQIHAAMYLYEEGDAATADDDRQTKLLDSFRAAPDFGKGENPGTAGVRFELLWRDYMRLCARKFGPKLFSLGGFRGAADATGWKRLGPSSGDASDVGTVRPVLERFLAGRTGIAFIDASQRELFLTGYTSNRVRQNVASFLAKHLNIDWRLGAEWYECMLVDYDVASNWGNWQYVAGVGNDPRQGRIFNPVKQALDYDPRGEYVKTWIPELRGLDIAAAAAATAGDGGGVGVVDEEKLMVLFQPWKLYGSETQRKLGLGDEDWLEQPLVKINFSVGRRPRPSNRVWGGRGNRGRGGRGSSSSRGRGRGRGGLGIGHAE